MMNDARFLAHLTLNQYKSKTKLDKVIEKNFNDAQFFAHTMRTTKDETKKEVTEMRLDIARSRTENAKRHLDCLIFP